MRMTLLTDAILSLLDEFEQVWMDYGAQKGPNFS
jgi:hypothetical protein